MKPTFDVIPKVAIHPTRINIYNEIVWTPYKPGRNHLGPDQESGGSTFDLFDPISGEIISRNETHVNSPAAHLLTSDKKTHGIVSPQARRKMGKAIDYLLYLSNDKVLPDTAHGKQYKFKIAFITLTLPSTQVHPDNVIKDQLLNQFLVELRKYYHVQNYIWRAEKQKNGNIHFHILVDRFIPWSEMRDRWNRICNKLGYVDRYRDEMKAFHSGGFQVRTNLLKSWEYKNQVKAYKAGIANDWASPNSTDIHSLYRIQKVKEYVTKYCTKNEENSEVIGRMWGCNYELSDIKGAVEIMDEEIKSEINEIIKTFSPRVYATEYFSVINLPVTALNCVAFRRLYDYFIRYIGAKFLVDVQSQLCYT